MSYINLTTTFAESCIGSAYDFSQSSDPFQRYALAWTTYLFAVPLSVATGTADTVIGLASRIGSLVTLGIFARINEIARNHMKSLQELLSMPYFCLIRAINLKASIQIPPNCLGYVANSIKIFKEKGNSFKNKGNFIEKHIISRLNYMLFGIAALVTRVIDQIISNLAVTLSLLTLGFLPKVNEVAFRSLMFPNLINDLTYSIVKVINPRASFY
jgi:hypothetical protein